MSDSVISLLLVFAGLAGVALIVTLPEGWFVRVTRRLRTNPTPVAPSRTPRAGDEFRLVCSECGEISSPKAAGWKAYLTFEGGPLFFCPACADRELHRSNDRRHRGPTE
jgi:predicted RNA-binding Zn-ribbon protein involved in translation (DUF1610 family)